MITRGARAEHGLKVHPTCGAGKPTERAKHGERWRIRSRIRIETWVQAAMKEAVSEFHLAIIKENEDYQEGIGERKTIGVRIKRGK